MQWIRCLWGCTGTLIGAASALTWVAALVCTSCATSESEANSVNGVFHDGHWQIHARASENFQNEELDAVLESSDRLPTSVLAAYSKTPLRKTRNFWVRLLGNPESSYVEFNLALRAMVLFYCPVETTADDVREILQMCPSGTWNWQAVGFNDAIIPCIEIEVRSYSRYEYAYRLSSATGDVIGQLWLLSETPIDAEALISGENKEDLGEVSCRVVVPCDEYGIEYVRPGYWLWYERDES